MEKLRVGKYKARTKFNNKLGAILNSLGEIYPETIALTYTNLLLSRILPSILPACLSRNSFSALSFINGVESENTLTPFARANTSLFVGSKCSVGKHTGLITSENMTDELSFSNVIS